MFDFNKMDCIKEVLDLDTGMQVSHNEDFYFHKSDNAYIFDAVDITIDTEDWNEYKELVAEYFMEVK